MLITPTTPLTLRPIMFADGNDGAYMQQHAIDMDDDFTGVTKIAMQHGVAFLFDGNEYGTVREALRAAGHDLS